MELEQALKHFKSGKPILLLDDMDRENEGDLCIAAEHVTNEWLLFFKEHTNGQLYVACNPLRCDELGATRLCGDGDLHKTPISMPLDLHSRHGVTTGVSLSDRLKTIRAIADPKYKGEDFVKPGHILTLRASPMGLKGRQGHTEASVELCKQAGLYPACLIAELWNPDGTIAKGENWKVFSEKHGIPIITIADLIKKYNQNIAEKVIQLPMIVNDSLFKPKVKIVGDVIVMVKGNVENQENVFLRIHSQCITGDVFGSCKCDCGPQLRRTIQILSESECGILLYIMNQEGRGIGLENKLMAYYLQEHENTDTFVSNNRLYLPDDCRDYSNILAILQDLHVKSVQLYTCNPAKIKALGNLVASVKCLEIDKKYINEATHKYLKDKNKYFKSGKKIGLVYCNKWHVEYVDIIVRQCREIFESHNISLMEYTVPGSFELVMGAKRLMDQGCNVVMAIGIVLQGETYHFTTICDSVSNGLMQLQLQTGKPVVNGMLQCYNIQQIQDRVTGAKNTVADWCDTAIGWLN